MKTSIHKLNSPVVHAAFLDALSGEFIARTGCGAYVHMDPGEILGMFLDYQRHPMPVRDYVKKAVRAFLTA